MLAEIEEWIGKEIRAGRLDQPVPREQEGKFKRFLERSKTLGTDLALPMVLTQIERLDEMISYGERDPEKLIATNREIRTRLEDELSSHKFLYVPSDRCEFYGARFGREVEDKFPTSTSDIENAGKCLALGLTTSSVFHLMRAMECSVQALSAKLSIQNTERAWGILLSDLHKTNRTYAEGS